MAASGGSPGDLVDAGVHQNRFYVCPASTPVRRYWVLDRANCHREVKTFDVWMGVGKGRDEAETLAAAQAYCDRLNRGEL